MGTGLTSRVRSLRQPGLRELNTRSGTTRTLPGLTSFDYYSGWLPGSQLIVKGLDRLTEWLPSASSQSSWPGITYVVASQVPEPNQANFEEASWPVAR